MAKDLIPSGDRSISKDRSYQNLLEELRSIFSKSQYQAYKAVDNIRVQTYWQIGERIVREELKHKERADYGKFLIENLAGDLGIPKRNLYRIVKFYSLYEKVASLMPQLSWTHYYQLVDIDDGEKRRFYEHQSILHSWSVRELQSQIKSQLYENTSREEIEGVFKANLPATTDPVKIFKDQYDFSPMGLQLPTEKDLEDKIATNIELFLKEMGGDFCFVGRQIPIRIDNQTHSIDLVLYHMGIPCNVLVDLKSGKFDSRDVGQMNKYVNYYRQNRQYVHEKDAIGLIICREVGREEIHYALGGLEEKIFVAEYQIKLPSEETIKKAIREL